MSDIMPSPPERSRETKILYAVVALGIILLAALPFLGALPAGGSGGGAASVGLYTTDSVTLLFDDYEDTNKSALQSASPTYKAGYLAGQALFLPTTTSWLEYNNSWWLDNGDGFQDSGTIEFYYRPETFIFTGSRSHAMVFTIGERPSRSRPRPRTLSRSSC